MMRAWITFVLAGTVLWSGCTSTRCGIDDDCYGGERCVVGHCEVVPPDRSGEGAFDEGREAGATDASRPTDDVGGAPDLGGAPDTAVADRDTSPTAADMADADTSTAAPDLGTGACIVDPFTFTCTDDTHEPNNLGFDGTRLFAGPLGCDQANAFEGGEVVVPLTMCPLDGDDWFSVLYSACSDGTSFVIEWQVEVTSACDPSLVEVVPSADCADPNVNCASIDGKPTVQIIVPSAALPLVSTTRLHVSNRDVDDITFDYRLRLSIRR